MWVSTESPRFAMSILGRMRRGIADAPTCPWCKRPVGVYEPVIRVDPQAGPERTSWLRESERGDVSGSLWHVACVDERRLASTG